MPRPIRWARTFSSRYKRRDVARLLILLAFLFIGAIIGFFLGRLKAAEPRLNKTKAHTSSPHASGARVASCADHSVGDNCINLDALDGTAGRQGPRSFRNSSSSKTLFPDPKAYLPRKDYDTYTAWVRYSQKPAGQDHVLPSKEYFSLGKTKPFTGDMNEPGVIEGLIKARSYKNEIIQFVVAGSGSLDLGLNFAFNLRDLGYDHWFIFGGFDDSNCKQIMQVMPDAACVWTSILSGPDKPMHGNIFGAVEKFWWCRWWNVARLLRFGLNVGNWDADVVMNDDFYRYVKSDTLKGLNWICGDEGSGSCNGGTNYIQNVAPNGPVAWAIAQLVERGSFKPEPRNMTVRLSTQEAKCMDDWPAYANHTLANKAVFDQNTLNAVLTTSRAGFQTAPNIFMNSLNWGSLVKEEVNSQEEVRLPAPAEWVERHGIKDVHVHCEILRVPRADLPKDWVDINISPGGALVRRVLHVLATESGAPPLPDHRTPLEERPTMPAESLWKVYFLVNTWTAGVRRGMWFGEKPPLTVVSHTVSSGSPHCRADYFKIVGWYHWKVDDLRMELDAQPAPYHSSTKEQPLPRVVAYSPALTMRVITQEQRNLMLVNLILVAAMSGRAIVLPPVACDSTWLLDASRNCSTGDECWYHDIPWSTRADPYEVVPLIDERYPQERLVCDAWSRYGLQCFKHMMLYVDFKHMMTMRLAGNDTRYPSASFEPLRSNTLWFEARDPAGAPPEYSSAVRSIDGRAMLAELASFEDQHAIYLNAVPLLSDVDSAAARELLPSATWAESSESDEKSGLSALVMSYISDCKSYGSNDDFRALLDKAAAKAPI